VWIMFGCRNEDYMQNSDVNLFLYFFSFSPGRRRNLFTAYTCSRAPFPTRLCDTLTIPKALRPIMSLHSPYFSSNVAVEVGPASLPDTKLPASGLR
jgi:hypothetical protein